MSKTRIQVLEEAFSLTMMHPLCCKWAHPRLNQVTSGRLILTGYVAFLLFLNSAVGKVLLEMILVPVPPRVRPQTRGSLGMDATSLPISRRKRACVSAAKDKEILCTSQFHISSLILRTFVSSTFSLINWSEELIV